MKLCQPDFSNIPNTNKNQNQNDYSNNNNGNEKETIQNRIKEIITEKGMEKRVFIYTLRQHSKTREWL